MFQGIQSELKLVCITESLWLVSTKHTHKKSFVNRKNLSSNYCLVLVFWLFTSLQ